MGMKDAGNTTLTVDARGLEPPEPLIIILEALGRVTDGMELRVQTDRRPIHLYPLLEQRGFTCETEEQDGGFVTKILRL
jgi:uncharacterized protein (DUF2249 family)